MNFGSSAAARSAIGGRQKTKQTIKTDLGASMEHTAKAVQRAVSSYPLDDVAATIRAIGHSLRRKLGGPSGPLYGVLFLCCGSVCAAAAVCWRNPAQRDWPNEPKRSIRAAALSV